MKNSLKNRVSSKMFAAILVYQHKKVIKILTDYYFQRKNVFARISLKVTE